MAVRPVFDRARSSELVAPASGDPNELEFSKRRQRVPIAVHDDEYGLLRSDTDAAHRALQKNKYVAYSLQIARARGHALGEKRPRRARTGARA
jgi:hypothetical protein